jgi:dTDP-4-amino-4,6-dideoxygalactose transaminase
MEKLAKQGVGSQVHYIPVFKHPYYFNQGYDESLFPNAMKYYQQGLSIPLFYELTEKDQEKVVRAIKSLDAKA